MDELKAVFTLIWNGAGRPSEWACTLLENGYTASVAYGSTKEQAEAAARANYAEAQRVIDIILD